MLSSSVLGEDGLQRDGTHRTKGTRIIVNEIIYEDQTETYPIEIPAEAIRDFCRRHHIRKLAFFGSILSDAFDAESDVDVLVEFEPGHTPGFAFFAMQAELSDLLGRQVDLQTPNFLSPYFRHEVEQQAHVHYLRE